MNKTIRTYINNLFLLFTLVQINAQYLKVSDYNLIQKDLANVWDEAMPLGNGLMGALVWEKNENLRLALDHVELWDLRPMENHDTEMFTFDWVHERWKKDEYAEVQKAFDEAYENSPGPTKIPGAALEFSQHGFGKVLTNELVLKEALNQITWESGVHLETFVHATEQAGWFRFKGLKEGLTPRLIPPKYSSDKPGVLGSSSFGMSLDRLGYSMGKVRRKGETILYEQEGWGGFKYQVAIVWKREGDVLEGCWSILPIFKQEDQKIAILDDLLASLNQGFDEALASHKKWWSQFWSRSEISVPDEILQRQWYMEHYKFGSVARADAPPISLQAVWTADNGKLPPWKGDFHHDLNTQLSYWPAYSGNRLDLEEGFVNWLDKYKPTFRKYTQQFYGVNGLNVPGVTTLTGDPMAGWIQYSFGPTVSAWLGHHFYLHWRYSMDRDFLEKKAYPWISETAQFFTEVSVKGADGKKKLVLSSSPEIHDNRRKAWFANTTNYDLAMIRWTYEKAAELAEELGQKKEASNWRRQLKQWPELSIDQESGLMVSPDEKFIENHRHFSHLVGFHPLGILDVSDGEEEKQVIENTLKNMDKLGSDYWVGYSFSWLGNLRARVFDGEGAAESLRIFAENFCLPNSFHVNGERYNRGYVRAKYRPFTLEGNFAFASGLQEMLIQSHTGRVVLFPAIPSDWSEISFDQLRTEGAFLVSAKINDKKVSEIRIVSEQGGTLRLKNPFNEGSLKTSSKYKTEGDDLIFETKKGQVIQLKSKIQ